MKKRSAISTEVRPISKTFSYQHGSPSYEQNPRYQPKKGRYLYSIGDFEIYLKLMETPRNFWKFIETLWKFLETSKQLAEDGNFQPLTECA